MLDIRSIGKLTPEMIDLYLELTKLEIEHSALQDKKAAIETKLSKNMQAQLEIQAKLLGHQAELLRGK